MSAGQVVIIAFCYLMFSRWRAQQLAVQTYLKWSIRCGLVTQVVSSIGQVEMPRALIMVCARWASINLEYSHAAHVLIGVMVLPDTDNCTIYSGVPLQHRPIVFFFDISTPRPLTDAIMCAPEAHVSMAQIAVDLTLNRTSVLEKEDVTSTIAGSPLNGLFSGAETPDQNISEFLSVAQNTLVSTMLNIVQTMDPSLEVSFVNHAFLNTTRSVYVSFPFLDPSMISRKLTRLPLEQNMYLRVLARGLYFEPVQSGTVPVPVQLEMIETRAILE